MLVWVDALHSCEHQYAAQDEESINAATVLLQHSRATVKGNSNTLHAVNEINQPKLISRVTLITFGIIHRLFWQLTSVTCCQLG
jgi:hypothetical protein